MQISELKEVVRRLVEENQDIEVVYLFGSAVKYLETKPSDIDLAFLFDRLSYKNNPLNAFFKAQIIGQQISEYCDKPVDVSLLNEASLFFIYEVITTGLCLYEKDRARRIIYEVAIKGQFYDFKPFITQLRDTKLKKVLETA